MDRDIILKAYVMRLEGRSWEDIALLLHYDRAYLSRTVNRALRRRADPRTRGDTPRYEAEN